VRNLALVVVALLGGVTGTLLTRLAPSGAGGQRQETSDVGEMRAQLERLSRENGRAAARIATLEADKTHGRATETAAPPPAAPAPSADLPRRETAAEQREHEAELLARHAAEPVDGPWAHDTSRDIGQALGALGNAGGLKVASLDCRSQTCLAHLSWPSMKAAQENRRAVLMLPSDLPCERHLYMGADGQRDDQFEGTLLLTCARGR
jgi:hypothetical protein